MKIRGRSLALIFQGGDFRNDLRFVQRLVAPLVTDDADEKKCNHRCQHEAGYQDGSVNRCFVGIHNTAWAKIKFTSKLIYMRIRYTLIRKLLPLFNPYIQNASTITL